MQSEAEQARSRERLSTVIYGISVITGLREYLILCYKVMEIKVLIFDHICNICDKPATLGLAPLPRYLMAYSLNKWKDTSLKFLQDTATGYKALSVFEQDISNSFEFMLSMKDRCFPFFINIYV